MMTNRNALFASFAILGMTLTSLNANAADKPSFAGGSQLDICTTAGFPPLSYMDKATDARPVGIDIEIADALSKAWGTNVNFITSGFDGLLPSLQAGRCKMVISGIYLTPKRREAYDAVPYMKSATVIVVRGADDAITKPDDLSGKLVALEAGTYFVEMLENLNGELKKKGSSPVEVQTYDSQLNATQQVIGGRADATFTEEAEGRVRIVQSSNAIKIAFTYPSEFNFGIYFQKNEKDAEAVKHALKELKSQGVFEQISKKYNLDTALFEVDYDS